MPKVRFDVISSVTGEQELYTGVFENEILADIWYDRFGQKLEARGKKLIRKEIDENENSDIYD